MVAAGGASFASFDEIGSLDMITLYGFGAGFGLPEISPFVTKTEVQLKMAGLAYRKEKGDAAGLAQGAVALYRRRGGDASPIPPSSAPISKANTASISTRPSACRRARRPGRSSG